MKINETQTKVVKAVDPRGVSHSVRFIYETHKIESDNDTLELCKTFAQGVEILITTPGKDCSYVIIKRTEEVKISL